MKKRNITISLVLLLTLAASNQKKPLTEKEQKQAFQFLQTNCFSCHSPKAEPNERVAPPMQAVKLHYKTDGIREKQFVEEFTAFVQKPSVEKSKMPGAVQRFNLMPKFSFTEEELNLAARYIFSADLERPDWMEDR